jgi:hypothetical protein
MGRGCTRGRRRGPWVRIGVVLVVLGSCSGDGSDGDGAAGPEGGSRPQAAIVVAGGDDGMAVVADEGVTPISAPVVWGGGGPMVAAIDDDTAAVVGGDEIRLLRAGGEVVATSECVGCAGIAFDGERIVSTRAGAAPGGAFDIVSFDTALEEVPTVGADRVAERLTVDHPPENTEGPVTLALVGDTLTVAYLSLNGAHRGGPTVVAQHSLDGELLESTTVPGVIIDSAPAPDREHLALAVGGFGGACITSSELEILTLQGLEALEVGSSLPPEADDGAGPLDEPWVQHDSLVWSGDAVHALGEVHRPPVEEVCDPQPTTVRHVVDTGSGDEEVGSSDGVVAERWLGDDCDDRVELVLAEPFTYELRSPSGVVEPGAYRRIEGGHDRPDGC